MTNGRKKVLIDGLFRIGVVLIFLMGLSLFSLWYSDREAYWRLFWYMISGAILLMAMIISILIYFKKKKVQRENKLINLIKQKGLEDKINNFIQVFGRNHKPKKGDWEFRGYSFDSERLNDFRDELNKDGINLTYKDFSDLSVILFYYIQKHERRVTTERIKSVSNNFGYLSGGDFENLLYRLFTARGYVVDKKGGSGDQGADLVASLNGDNIVIQAKCYSGSVGNKAVQEAVAAKNQYNCNKAIVVTNASFTKGAVELANSNNVELVDGDRLREDLYKYLKESWN